MSADHFNAKDRIFGAQRFAEVLWKLGEMIGLFFYFKP